jgi:hypothetical protein
MGKADGGKRLPEATGQRGAPACCAHAEIGPQTEAAHGQGCPGEALIGADVSKLFPRFGKYYDGKVKSFDKKSGCTYAAYAAHRTLTRVAAQKCNKSNGAPP